MAIKNVKKISVAIVFGRIDTPEGLRAFADGKQLHVMSVMGQAIGIKAGTTQRTRPDGSTESQAWEGLQGVFKAVNPSTGEEFRSSTLFLPEIALVPIKVAMIDPNTQQFRGTSFAFNLYAARRTDGKPGGVIYEYSYESMLPLDESDPIRQIEKQLLALAAPPAADPGPGVDSGATVAKRKR